MGKIISFGKAFRFFFFFNDRLTGRLLQFLLPSLPNIQQVRQPARCSNQRHRNESFHKNYIIRLSGTTPSHSRDPEDKSLTRPHPHSLSTFNDGALPKPQTHPSISSTAKLLDDVHEIGRRRSDDKQARRWPPSTVRAEGGADAGQRPAGAPEPRSH